MKIQRPEVILDGLYNKKEAAKLLGVDRHTVRKYELDGLIIFKARRCGGRTVTTGEQILKCWGEVYHL